MQTSVDVHKRVVVVVVVSLCRRYRIVVVDKWRQAETSENECRQMQTSVDVHKRVVVVVVVIALSSSTSGAKQKQVKTSAARCRQV